MAPLTLARVVQILAQTHALHMVAMTAVVARQPAEPQIVK